MRRPATIVLLLWILALVAHAEDPGRAYLESLDVRLVSLDVTVSSADGEPVTGLTVEDFEILDEGQAVEITHFAAPVTSAPVSPAAVRTDLKAVLFLDDAELLPAQRGAVFGALRDQLDALLAVASEVMLVRRGETARVEQTFTSSREKLLGGLDRLARDPSPIGSHHLREQALLAEIRQARGLPPPAGGQATWVRGDRAENEALSTLAVVRELSRERRSRTLSSLRALSHFISALHGVAGRKVMLYVSQGIDTRPGERLFQAWLEKFSATEAARRSGSVELESATYHLSEELADLLEEAAGGGVRFYCVTSAESSALAEEVASAGPRFRTDVRRERTGDLAEQMALRGLAERSAGRFFPDLQALRGAVGKIADDEAGRYSFGYPLPSGAEDGAIREVSVRLRSPERHSSQNRLRHPSSYRVERAGQRLRERAAAALLLDNSDNPLGAEVEVSEESGRVALELRVPMAKLAFLPDGDVHRGELSAYVLTQDVGGLISSGRVLEAPIEIPNARLALAMSQFGILRTTFELAPGDRRIAVAVRDEVGRVDAALVFRIRAEGNPP